MERNIRVLDNNGMTICNTANDFDHSDGSLIGRSIITYREEKYNVIHILGLNYCMIIPDNTAKMIEFIVNNEPVTIQQNKDVLNKNFGSVLEKINKYHEREKY